ncbi:MAG: RNA methyltransferase [Lachnospiraceae bacterium]|nr:RNA methyltransferase [Lachnospiraceae bacterium]
MATRIRIQDLTYPELDIYAREREAQLKFRPAHQPGIFIAESPIVIERALDAGYQPISLLMEDAHFDKQGRKIIERCGDIPVYTAPFEVLTGITGFQLTRGMLCAMYRGNQPFIEEVCMGARRIAVLENVVNPTNVGAIFRSAAALNMDAVLLTPACSDPLYRRAIRVSMGTVFQVPWTFLPDGEQYVEYLRHLDFKTAAMALSDDSVSIDHPSLRQEERLAIVLGTEGEGLAKSTIEQCDYTVKIPMSHGVDSLNVAAASAVVFWELGKEK